MRKLMFSKLLSSVMVIAGFALFIFVGKHVFATPNATGGAGNQTKDRASKPPISAESLEKSEVFQLEGEPEDPAFWDMGEPSAKIVAGANANAVLSLDLIADGGSGNQRDDGVTTGTVSGQGTTIAIEVFATGVTTSLRGVILKFEFDASLLSYVKAENSAFPLAIPDASVGTNLAATTPATLAASGFLARAEFETVADVTGREFAIGIESVTLAESSASQDELATTREISFNATPSPDFDGDGTVGFSDFLAFASGFGTQQGDSRYDVRFDLDGNGSVDFSDFLIFAGAFGSQVSPSGAGATVTIADANLRAVIADSLGKARNAPVTRAEMATLTRIDAPNNGILSLAGLEHATNLQRLGLGRVRVDGALVNSNVISNLSPLSNLTNLTFLDLTSNRISDISALSNLTNLTELHLGGNQTISDISALTNLTNLTRLNLWTNRISDISALARLTDLTYLALSQNELNGAIPTELGKLTNLEQLYLWGNQLNGAIPTELGNLTNLEQLYLGDNELNGAIPTEFGNLTNLEGLYLWGNQLDGAIPTELGNLTNLEQLYLWGNQLDGAIPTELGNLTNLEQLYLGQNELNGAIPTGLGNLTNLTVLHLGDNELNGAIPTELGNLTNLEGLYLGDNELSGAIPSELGNLINLTELWISNNAALTGSLPQSLTNLTKLEVFNFDATGLCAPLDAAFQTWLQGIEETNGENCSGTSPPSGNPDLIVESPSVNDSTLTTGQSFTLSATVRNQGNASSAATTLRYYRSSDATISTNDVEAGTDEVSSLSAGVASAESISLNAPSSTGTYYYGGLR